LPLYPPPSPATTTRHPAFGRGMSLRALRDELKGLLAATEDAAAKITTLDAKARPYTLNPNGSVSYVQKGGRITSDISSAHDRPGHGGHWLPSERRALASVRPGGVVGGAASSRGGSASMPALPVLHPRRSAIASAGHPQRIAAIPAPGGGTLGADPSSATAPFGTTPTNRFEAMLLARSLDEQLESAGSSFNARLETMEAAFEEMTRQVGVHCAERGHALAKMRAFYSSYAAAFGSLTRKRQHDAGFKNLDAQLESSLAAHNRLALRVGKLEGRLKAIEQVLDAGDSSSTARLLALAAGSDNDTSLENDLLVLAVGERMESANLNVRSEVLLKVTARLKREERQAALALLIAKLDPEEQSGVLYATLDELLPASRYKALSSMLAALTPGEQLECIGTMTHGMQQTDLVTLLRMPLSRLPKEKTLEVMEVLLQMSPAISSAVARLYYRMSESQRLQALHLLCAKMEPAEVKQLKSELKLESAVILQKLNSTEAELARAQQEVLSSMQQEALADVAEPAPGRPAFQQAAAKARADIAEPAESAGKWASALAGSSATEDEVVTK